MKLLTSLITVALTLIIAGLFTLNMMLSSQLNYQDQLEFEVKAGEGFNSALLLLEKKIKSFPVKAAKVYLKLSGQEQDLKVSEYEIPKGLSAYDILKILMKGQLLEEKVTLQEGINIFQIAEILEEKKLASKKEFLDLVQDPKVVEELLGFQASSLEGYIFPDTYMLPKKWKVKQYLKIFVEKFSSVWQEIEKKYDLQMTRHQTIILASIIEKETGAGFERPMISSVFHNRLRKSMRLQTDPTVLYGKWIQAGGGNVINITRKDLKTPSAYNTYTIFGLPLGPIANPGKSAIIAAINPIESENLYFVSKNDGTHKFSKTYKDHNEAVKKFQLDPKARQGKSWRDLKEN